MNETVCQRKNSGCERPSRVQMKGADMLEVVAFAFVVSVAFVLIGKTVAPDHQPNPRGWKRIWDHDRVYYMGRGQRK